MNGDRGDPCYIAIIRMIFFGHGSVFVKTSSGQARLPTPIIRLCEGYAETGEAPVAGFS